MHDDLPQTLIEAVRYFSDLSTCHAYMRRIKWPDGKPTCPHCGSENVGEITTRAKFQCRDCRRQTSYKAGTIFEDSPLGLDRWFVAVWSIANCKNGISSHELSRALGVTQKTAWFMLHRIRAAMQAGGLDQMDGPAEADTTYVGGRAENMHAKRRERKIRGRGASGKAAVHGVLRRNTADAPSEVRAAVLEREDSRELVTAVRKNVRYGAQVYTDEALAYGDLALTHFHAAIDHSRAYVAGAVHVNGLENFWSLLKRTLHGTYVAVSPWHLIRYVAEQAQRFNDRRTNDATRFHRVMSGIVGKRLTWRQLAGVEDAGFMGLT